MRQQLLETFAETRKRKGSGEEPIYDMTAVAVQPQGSHRAYRLICSPNSDCDAFSEWTGFGGLHEIW